MPAWLSTLGQRLSDTGSTMGLVRSNSRLLQPDVTCSEPFQANEHFVQLRAKASRSTAGDACSERAQCGLAHGAFAESDTLVWLTEVKDAALPQTQVQVRHVRQVSTSHAEFSISCKGVAALLSFEALPIKGHFLDNMVCCLPGEQRDYRFLAEESFKLTEFKQYLAISFLNQGAFGRPAEHVA